MKSIEVPRAGASALNKSAALIRTRSIRGTAAKVRIKQKSIRQRYRITRANPRKPRARIHVYVRPISAISQFTDKKRAALTPGRGTNSRGVRVAGRQFNSAFITAGKSGNVHIFQRKTRDRYPIEVIKFDISNEAQVVTNTVAQRVMKSEYKRLLVTDLRYRLRRLGV